jgi:tetratricopeptide (TPR) repeat protein
MDRITNESNLWLNAIKMEDEGNYLKAFVFYLKDSSECIKQNSFVRAALSCSCAADCLAMNGNLAGARQLYLQTACLYENNAIHVIGNSIREALWSYQEAYEYFHLACENNKAQNIYEKYVSLSRKTNPFFGEKEAMESLRIRKTETESHSGIHTSNMQVSADVDNAIQNFLQEIAATNDDRSDSHIFQKILHKISEKKS